MKMARRMGIVGILSVFAMVALPHAAQAQDRDRDQSGRVTCASNGGRVNCDVDTHEGRSYGEAA